MGQFLSEKLTLRLALGLLRRQGSQPLFDGVESMNLSVLWRVEHAEGTAAYAVLSENAGRTKLAWYLDHELLGSEEFETRAAAMRRAEELRLLQRIGRC